MIEWRVSRINKEYCHADMKPYTILHTDHTYQTKQWMVAEGIDNYDVIRWDGIGYSFKLELHSTHKNLNEAKAVVQALMM